MLGKSVNLEAMDSSKSSRMHQASKMMEKVVKSQMEFD